MICELIDTDLEVVAGGTSSMGTLSLTSIQTLFQIELER